MRRTRRRAARRSVGTIVVALLLGLLVLLVLLPAGGADTQPPECWAYLIYPVPCDRWVAPLAGAVTARLVGLGLWKTIDAPPTVSRMPLEARDAVQNRARKFGSGSTIARGSRSRLWVLMRRLT